MAIANIIIQQGDGNQTPESRDDLVLNSVVTLLNQSNTGVTSWIWQMVDKPSGSTAVLSSSTVASPTFTPDIAGTYLIRLMVNSGVSTDQKGAAVKTTHFRYRIPAASEEGEFDSVRGWAGAVNDALADIDDGYGANSINPNAGTIGAGAGAGSFTWANGNAAVVAPDNRAAAVAATGSFIVFSEDGYSHESFFEAQPLRADISTAALHVTSPLSSFSGSVGIGGSPTFALDIQGGAAQGSYGFINANMSSSASEAGLQISNTSADGHQYTILSTGTGSSIGTGKFVIGDGTAGQPRFTIDQSGNIGINTASPAAVFDIIGTARVSSTLNVGNDITITGSGQYIANNAVPIMRLGQKNNGEVVWSVNVDQNNGDTMDNPSDSAWKFSIQTDNGGTGLDAVSIQHTPTGQGTWSGTPLFKLDHTGALTINKALTTNGVAIDLSGSISSGQVLAYNGTSFVPTTTSGGSTTLQQAYVASAGAIPSIHVSSGNGAFKIYDNASPIGTLFEIANSDGSIPYITIDSNAVNINAIGGLISANYQLTYMGLDTINNTQVIIGANNAATGGSIGKTGSTSIIAWSVTDTTITSPNQSVNLVVNNAGVEANANITANSYIGVQQTINGDGAISVNTQLGDTLLLSSFDTGGGGSISSITLSSGQPGQIFTLNMFQGNASYTWPTAFVGARIAGGTFTKTATQQSVDTITFRWNQTKTKWDEIGRAINIS